MPADRPNHARARELRDERVDRIISMMNRGEWEGSRSHNKLAAEWGVGTNTVADYAREASGVNRRLAEENKAELLAEMLGGIQFIRRGSLAKTRTFVTKDGNQFVVDDPDFRSALQAIELHMKAMGLIVTKTQEVSPYDGMSKDELEAKAAELREKLGAAGGGK